MDGKYVDICFLNSYSLCFKKSFTSLQLKISKKSCTLKENGRNMLYLWLWSTSEAFDGLSISLITFRVSTNDMYYVVANTTVMSSHSLISTNNTEGHVLWSMNFWGKHCPICQAEVSCTGLPPLSQGRRWTEALSYAAATEWNWSSLGQER